MTTGRTDVDGRTTDDEYEAVRTDVNDRTKDVEYGKAITTRNMDYCGTKRTRDDTERKLNATKITEIRRERGSNGKERTNETMKDANKYDETERIRTKRALELCTSYERLVTDAKDDLVETDLEMHGTGDKLEAVAGVIPYKDVEGTFTKFKGDEKENIIEWLDFFDHLCVWAKWDEFYKYVNLLKSLEDTVMGFAKLDGGHDYGTLRAVLLRRYGSNVTRGKLLRRMAERKKERTETVAEYVLDMVRWGRAARLNDREIAEFVAGGVDTGPAVKLRLYRIHDLMELQESVEDMERQTMRSNGERRMIGQAGVCWRLRRCVNCGGKEHETDECPGKSFGRKCFNCNRYGHVSAFCPEKVQRVMIGANEGPGIVGPITMGVTVKDDCQAEYVTNDRSGSTKEDHSYTVEYGVKMRDGTALDKSEDVNELKERAMRDTVANKVTDEDNTSRSATELNGDDVNRDLVNDDYRTAEGGVYEGDADKDESKDGDQVNECKNDGEVAADIIEHDEKSASCGDGSKEAVRYEDETIMNGKKDKNSNQDGDENEWMEEDLGQVDVYVECQKIKFVDRTEKIFGHDWTTNEYDEYKNEDTDASERKRTRNDDELEVTVKCEGEANSNEDVKECDGRGATTTKIDDDFKNVNLNRNDPMLESHDDEVRNEETNGDDDELELKVECGDKAIANEDAGETDLDWKNVKLSGNDSIWDRGDDDSNDEEAKGDESCRTVAEVGDEDGDSRRDADEERSAIKEMSVVESEWVACVIGDRAECGVEDVARVDAIASRREDEMRGRAGVMRDGEGQNADAKRVIGNEKIARENTRMVGDHLGMLKKMKDPIPEAKQRWRSNVWGLIDAHEIRKRILTLSVKAYEQQGHDLAPRGMLYELKRLIERSVPVKQLTEEILAEGENGSEMDEGAEQSYSRGRFTSGKLREGGCDRVESEANGYIRLKVDDADAGDGWQRQCQATDTGYIEYPERNDGMRINGTVAEVGELKDQVDYQRSSIIECQERSIVNERATFMMRTFVRCGGAKGDLLIANASGGGELKGRIRERGM